MSYMYVNSREKGGMTKRVYIIMINDSGTGVWKVRVISYANMFKESIINLYNNIVNENVRDVYKLKLYEGIHFERWSTPQSLSSKSRASLLAVTQIPEVDGQNQHTKKWRPLGKRTIHYEWLKFAIIVEYKSLFRHTAVAVIDSKHTDCYKKE